MKTLGSRRYEISAMNVIMYLRQTYKSFGTMPYPPFLGEEEIICRTKKQMIRKNRSF